MSDSSISVIIACYNSADTIVRALESVMSQTYLPCEILVYDDASTDTTVAILHEYCRRYQNITLYRGHENKGVGFARQFLINKVQGEFIAFLDSDDVWYPEKLQLQIAKLMATDADICISDYEIMDELGKRIGVRKVPKVVTFFSLHFANWIPTSMALFRSSITNSVTMTDLRTRQDYAYWLSLFEKKSDTKCVAVNQVLGTYYRDGNGLSGSAYKNIKANYKMFRFILKYSKSKACLVVFLNCVVRVIRV